MTDAYTALDAKLGVLLLVLNLGIFLFLAILTYHVTAMRRERRAQADELADQVGRALTSLQKINSNVVAHTNESKGRASSLKPALEQAEKLVREGNSVASDFKAVRGELRQLDERVEGLNRATTEATAAQAATSGALAELSQQVGALRQELSASAPAQPALVALPELHQIQEQVVALRQAVYVATQAQNANTTGLRTELGTLAAGQSRAAQAVRDALAQELREQEGRFRQLTEKFLAESAQLRARMESESRSLPPPIARQVALETDHSVKAELDAETRKEFRKLAERLDGFQRRMEEIIRL